ncbi:MAG: hypothetical protein EAZ89_08980 [Bacteroidetes bacterium]|nr:MAG: hypothetical protein EAZ89_08980 [Bacteroidota bacterium]
MTYEEFQQRYEAESDETFARLNKLDEKTLLAMIAARHKDIWDSGGNYQIWRVLAQKGSESSIWPLFDIVSDLRHAYLIRYHACDALFEIAGIRDEGFKGEVQYGLDTRQQPVDQQQAIRKLEQMLRASEGTRVARPVKRKPWWKIG